MKPNDTKILGTPYLIMTLICQSAPKYLQLFSTIASPPETKKSRQRRIRCGEPSLVHGGPRKAYWNRKLVLFVARTNTPPAPLNRGELGG